MKKIFLTLLFVLLTSNAWSSTVTFDSGATVSDSWLDNTFYTIYNEFNGGIDTDNITDGSITSNDIVSNTNPLNRDFHNIGEYVYSGLLPTKPAASLTMTTPAGVAYIANDGDSTLHQVTTSGTAKAYTANKDTYVFLDYTGSFDYDVQNTGATQPATPSNSIVLFKVIAGATITTVTDLRQTTPPNLRVYTSYITGCVISRDITTANKISIDIGEVDFGTGSSNLRKNITPTYINLGTTGRGALDTGTLANAYYYLWAYPDPDDSTTFEALASLSPTSITAVTDVDDERLIGWAYATTTAILSPDSVGAYKGLGSNQPNFAQSIVSGDDTITAGGYANLSGVDNLRMYTSGRPVRMTASWFGSGAGSTVSTGTRFVVDGVSIKESELRAETGIATHEYGLTHSYIHKLNAGEHTFALELSASSNINIHNRILTVQEL